MQHGGLPIIAPDKEIFREVLGASGAYIRPDRPTEAAAAIADMLAAPHWRGRCAELEQQNVVRWNALAEEDRRNAIAFLAGLCGDTAAEGGFGEDRPERSRIDECPDS